MSSSLNEIAAVTTEALSQVDEAVSLLSSSSAPTGDVSCSEGDVVEAASGQGINFGAVTSCMTVTCILADGSKVAGHAWQFGYDHILSSIKSKLSGRTVSEILVAGVGGVWTPDFENQATMMVRYKKANSIPERRGDGAHGLARRGGLREPRPGAQPLLRGLGHQRVHQPHRQ